VAPREREAASGGEDMNNGLLLCDDLIFTSRVVGTATALGLTLRSAKTVEQLRGFLHHATPRCVILDIHTPGLDIENLLQEIAALTPRPFVVGYGSHVDAATLKKARDAGCDVVWPRSKFVDELARALPGWFGTTESQS
jgi:DNA-binding NarL/FixJ family response regulator